MKKNKFLIFLRKNILLTIFVILLVIWSLGPVTWTFIMSVMPEKNLIQKPPILNIKDITFNNYKLLLPERFNVGAESGKFDVTGTKAKREIQDFKDALKNSIIVSTLSTVLNVIISTVAGYAFTRFKFYGKRFLFLIIILTMPIPVVVFAIPLIKIMATLHLADTYIGLTILYTAFAMPLTIWMSSSYFQTIPKDLEDASYIDGCSRTQTFFKILIPLAKPVIASVAIISFLSGWSQFFLPLIFASSKTKQLSVVIANFAGKYIIQKGLMSAGGIIAMVAPIILVLFFSRFIISGLTKGGVKQ